MRMMAAAAHDARTHNSPHTHTRTTHHTQTKTPTHLGPAQRMRDPGEARLSSSRPASQPASKVLYVTSQQQVAPSAGGCRPKREKAKHSESKAKGQVKKNPCVMDDDQESGSTDSRTTAAGGGFEKGPAGHGMPGEDATRREMLLRMAMPWRMAHEYYHQPAGP